MVSWGGLVYSFRRYALMKTFALYFFELKINFGFCVLFYFGASSPYMEQRDRRTDSPSSIVKSRDWQRLNPGISGLGKRPGSRDSGSCAPGIENPSYSMQVSHMSTNCLRVNVYESGPLWVGAWLVSRLGESENSLKSVVLVCNKLNTFRNLGDPGRRAPVARHPGTFSGGVLPTSVFVSVWIQRVVDI